MSDCHNQKERKARKDHDCCECKTGIKKGDLYHCYSGVFDRRPYSEKMCGNCNKVYGYISSLSYVDVEEIYFGEVGVWADELFGFRNNKEAAEGLSIQCGVSVNHLNSMRK